MNKPQIQLTKTCSSCGLQKPISAFLEMSGQLGSRYGNICSSCRKTQAEKKAEQPRETEGSTTNVSGGRIDADAKIHGDRAKLEYKEQVNKLYSEEREKTGKLDTEKSLKDETIAKDQKTHRLNYLRSFLGGGEANKKDSQARAAQKAETIQARIAAETTIRQGHQETQQKQEQSAQQEQALKTVDFSSGPFIASQGEEKFKTSEFNKVKAWFGFNAPIISQAEKIALHNAKNQTSSSASTPKSQTPQAEKESPSEHIRNRWKR